MADLGKLGEKLRNPRVAIPAGAVVLTGTTAGFLGFFLKQWVYVIVALLVVLVALLAYLIWAMYSKEREDRVVRGTGPGEDATIIRRRDEQRGARTLEEGFRKAVAVIESRGLQALPWYLVLGASGAGKTALLRASGLDVSPTVERLVDPGPTGTCNWWLTNQAVLIDPAGRIATASEGADHKEWRHLLQLVRKHRPRPALHGVLVVLSVPDLLSEGSRQLEARASDLRRHLNEIVDQLAVDPPVYLLVSQSDRLPGFAELAVGVGRERVKEAFGWTHRDRHPHDVGRAVREAFARMQTRLEAMLPDLLVHETNVQKRRDLFLLPQELESLGRGAASFAARAFQSTRYDEVPFLRGIYLTSAVREGVTVSSVLGRLGNAPTTGPVDGSGPPNGWYLRDFFRRLLLDSEEQSLAVPTDRVGPRTRAVIVGLATALSLCVAGLWAVSFWKNWGAIAAVRDAAHESADQPGGLESLERLRVAVTEGEAAREKRIHGFGLGSGLERALERGRRGFIASFGGEFEEGAKARLAGAVRKRDQDAFSALQDLAADVTYLSTQGREERARPALERYSDVSRNEVERMAFRSGYEAFVRWSPTSEIESRIENERRLLDEQAPRLLEIGRLEEWCEANASVAPPVTYTSVGLPDPGPDQVGRVSGCYTRKFYEERLANLIASLDRSGKLARESVDRFRDEYSQRFAEQWETFLVGAPRPPIADAEVRSSPYIQLVAAVDDNTRVDNLWRGETPEWIQALHEARRKEGGDEEKPAPWIRYEKAIDGVATLVEKVRGKSHLSYAVVKEVSEAGETPFKQAIDLVQKDLVPIDPEQNDNRTAKLALREILTMPILNGFSAVLETAAREVDQVWRSQVVAPFPPPLTPEQHAARQMAITQFKTQTLAPFVAGSGLRPLLEDRMLPLSDDFLRVIDLEPRRRVADKNTLRSGDAAPDGGGGGGGGPPPSGPQTVRMIGAPSEVLGGGQVFVVGQELTLTCASQPPQRFEYSDGVGQKSFTWRPDCDYVQLVVRVRGAGGSEIEIPREWSGPFAFAEFLETGIPAADGARQWTLADPSGSGVRVAVRYKDQGSDGVIRYKEAMSRSLPDSATR